MATAAGWGGCRCFRYHCGSAVLWGKWAPRAALPAPAPSLTRPPARPFLQLKAALQGGHFELSSAEVEQLLGQVDAHPDGTIDLEEWVAAMADLRTVRLCCGGLWGPATHCAERERQRVAAQGSRSEGSEAVRLPRHLPDLPPPDAGAGVQRLGHPGEPRLPQHRPQQRRRAQPRGAGEAAVRRGRLRGARPCGEAGGWGGQRLELPLAARAGL